MNEPVTVFTDLLIAVVSLLAFFKLRKLKNPSRMINYFIFYFLLFAISTLIAGVIGHGFINEINIAWKLPGWIAGMISVLLLSLAGLEHLYGESGRALKTNLRLFMILISVIMIGFTLITFDFRVVVMHAVIILLGVIMPLNLFQYFRNRNRGSKYLVAGVLTAALAAIIFTLKISFTSWFTYNDISHVIIAMSTFIFFLAAGYSEAEPTFSRSPLV